MHREVERQPVIMVNQNHYAGQVVHQVQQGNMFGENNLAAILERIMD